MGINCVEVFIRLHLLVFYITVVGLSPAIAGLALGIAIFWDALADPIIGTLSDRTRQKWGRRTGWLLAGIVMVSCSLVALLNPPHLHSDTAKFFYLLLGSLIFNTSYTLLTVPYSAMVGDVTTQEHERVQLIGWRMAFGNLGAFAGVALPSYFLIRKIPLPYSKATFAIAAVVLISGLTAWTSVHLQPKKLSARDSSPLPWYKALAKPLQNAAFRPLLAAYFMANMGLTFNTSLALYFYRLHLKFSEKDIQSVLLLFLLVWTMTIPFWVVLSKKVSKSFALMMGVFLLGLTTFFIYPLLQPNQVASVMFWASGLGGFFIAASVLLESLLTDIVKKQEEQENKDLMGLYFGVWKMMAKISRGLALALTGQLLAWSEVTPGSSPMDGPYARLAIAFGPVVAFFFLCSALILFINLRHQKRALWAPQ